MTLNKYIEDLQKLRDWNNGGNFEVYAIDDQGGSYEVGGARVSKNKEYVEWGALYDYYEEYEDEEKPERVIIINMGN